MTQIIESFSEISDRYDAVFCDLWGCLHNGHVPFADAVSALEAFGAQGGTVLLLTNSPRPKVAVERQLDKIGVARSLYHEIASSGDAAQAAVAAGTVGAKVHHIGPDRDLGFFASMKDDFFGGTEVELVPLKEAEGIVCTGLFDDFNETPENYRATFLYAKNAGLKFLCANPDLVVDSGDRRIYCAGALAAAYTEMGGESLYFGKPHPPVYDLARSRMAALGLDISDSRILCIGDGINTDIKGAIGDDLDSLFISGGLASEETGTVGEPDPQKLDAFLGAAQMSPTFTMGHLR